jgi:hypothetical protein
MKILDGRKNGGGDAKHLLSNPFIMALIHS